MYIIYPIEIIGVLTIILLYIVLNIFIFEKTNDY